jgi:hypothetical protein
MGKNGGRPTDNILTLEEALRRFKHRRSQAAAEASGDRASDSNLQQTDLSATVVRDDEENPRSDQPAADQSVSVSAQRDETSPAIPAGEDIVALIEGIPRTLEELERIAAAEKAYREDFPDDAPEIAEVEDDSETAAPDLVALAKRRALIRDYSFTAMGAALMVLVAFIVTRAPSVDNRPTLIAQSIATPALKASTLMSADDLITTLVIIPDSDAQVASAGPRLPADQLEALIKHTLRSRAFPDIGVSVSKKGDAYLAGEVYSVDEARKIEQIVHRVNGVRRVHFLHPDVRSPNGPAYFGVTTAWAPEVWGAKVQAVFIGSPADKAGLQPGDVISEFDGNTIPDAKAFDDLLAQYSPGQRVQFRVWHDGQPEYLVARMGEATTVASR